MPNVLAVDFGGTKVTVALIDDRGAVRSRLKLAAAPDLDGSVQQVADALRGHDHIEAIGIIVPGIFNRRTGRAWCPNLWGPGEVALGEALGSHVHVPVVIDSDRAGYVLGEAWLGAARDQRHVAFVAIGTGIGVGILTGGRLLSGAHGIGGAAGWFALNPDWNDTYGRTGCWEAESAGPAIAGRFGAGGAGAVVDAARKQDPDALKILMHAARYMGMGVANLISLLNPEMVVLGGGVIHGAGDLLLDAVRAEAARWAQPIAMSRCRIELTQLGEDAGLFGAARLALNLISKPEA